MTIIFLNGCTSSGKSSIAAVLQERLAAPYLRMGIDDAFSTVPPKYHQHKEGFFFGRDERGLVRLNMGPVGQAALRAHRHGAAAGRGRSTGCGSYFRPNRFPSIAAARGAASGRGRAPG